ncbi:hypothetical protein [Prescottella agglutinans]|uniref:Uncharacterized protein n=1 Tax=Prescottella agglutinans TaxID=1644129 RepID=A0ABT6MKZ1_9NOCA|nr:hypothetical protein [Prescottella agglutinans]MDH6284555.1 hypothetical protein [Prescottella agglutinans]
MINALAALMLAVTAATRLHRWWFQRSLTLAGAFIVLACMSLHMILNVQAVEEFVRDAFGPSTPGSVKMLLVCGICVGTAIVFTDVTSQAGQRKKLLRFHITMSLLTATLSFAFFYTNPWPADVTNREFDNHYAFLPGYAEGLILGMTYPFLLALSVTAVAIAQADRRTVTGRGLMLIVPGAAILTAYAALRIGYLFAARYGLMEPTPTPFAISRVLAVGGVFFIAAGVLGALTMNWRASRAALRQFSDLRDELLRRWPGAERESRPGCSAGERVDDRAAELLDALSLEVECSNLPAGRRLPQDDTAEAIATWITTGEVTDGLGYDSFFLESGTSDTQWASALGRAYSSANANERKMVSQQ